MLIPRKHQRQRQLVYAAVKCLGKRKRNLDGAVSVVTLSHIHNTGQTANGAKIQVIKAIFAAGKGENNRIGRCLLDKIGIVVAPGTRAVAAAHQKEVTDGTRLNRVDYGVSRRQNRASCKAGGQHAAAVNAGHHRFLGVAAKLKRLVDDGGKVLFLPDVNHVGVCHHRGGKDAVAVAVAHRHNAVGGKQHGTRDVNKLLLLVLPCRAEVALELRVFLELGVRMGGQHLAVGVDIYALALGLLQQQVQVVQVVTRNNDKRSLFNGHGYLCGDGGAVGFGVGFIKQRHAGKVYKTGLGDQRKQLILRGIAADCRKGLIEEGVYLVVGIAQRRRVIRIRCHAANAE